MRSLEAQQASIDSFAMQRPQDLIIVTLGEIQPDTPFFSALIEKCIHARVLPKRELYSLAIAIPPLWKLRTLEHLVGFSSEQILSFAQSVAGFESSLSEILARSQVRTVDDYFALLKFIAAVENEQREVLEHPETELLVPGARDLVIAYAPSIRSLELMRTTLISLHDLTWRQLEELVADLLSQDGYQVELGPGSKDGGKDIIAIKHIPGVGEFMAIWQAKKLKPGKPVGLNTIRELADTRQELKASKGIIVTTTHLTRGALTRIEQDRYWLHKVDGSDLQTWIRTGQQP